MRKLVVAAMFMLVPFAAWTAGCRNDSSRAAFPKGPEVKGLARAATMEDVQPTVPMVPAPIDREVMNGPDQLTFARIRSVRDKEERLAGEYADAPGLFVLPAENDDLASLVGPGMTPPSPVLPFDGMEYQPVRVIPIGNPGEEPLPEPVPVSALASAPAPSSAPAVEFWSRPAAPLTSAYGFMPPPVDVSAMAPAAITLPVQPPPAAPDPHADPTFPPESIPGIFTGGGEEPTAFVAPKIMLDPAGDVNPPLLLSSAPAAAKTEELASPAPEAVMIPPPPAWSADSPPPSESGVETAFPEKASALLLLQDDVKMALAPLEPIAPEKPEPAAEREPAGKAAEEPPPLSPNLFEMKGEENPPAEIFMPGLQDDAAVSVPSGMDARDIYRMDFWDNQRAPGLPSDVTPPGFGASGGVRDSVPEKMEPPVPPEADIPQKVTLLPIMPMPARNPGLERIDSSVEAPPLKF